MKITITCSLLIVFIGCGKSDDELRKMMQDQISKASRSYVTSAQVIGPYTPAVKVGGLVFISGQVGISQETGELVSDDTESQTKQALINLLSIAEQAGCDSSDIVQCSVFLRDIKDFPKQYETLVGERGITLSGGQKQRTAIARAVIRQPKILILDDSLSAVDTYTEEKILAQLRGMMRERTSLIVSHRISTVKDADLICVLDHGKIVERGTHDELMLHGGEYADLYERQLLEEELAAS